ncbi:hypothetical protein Y032_0093g2615 [Ancylostoma ceylanicum]|uniref:Uncharacterized protein n=1 Tax=Ancylostoma ceylanicum TaxID=53326 RepID=A0A016TLB7_9BILA|nr:hypothetical protein Y032_0093g2615 [Ancylostoma ceylanicum]
MTIPLKNFCWFSWANLHILQSGINNHNCCLQTPALWNGRTSKGNADLSLLIKQSVGTKMVLPVKGDRLLT